MKKIAFALAFLAITLTTISAQSCSKKAADKSQSSMAIVTPPIDKMPKIEDKKNMETAAETPVSTVADKPVIAVVDTQKKVEIPVIVAEKSVEKPVIIEPTIEVKPQTTVVIETPQVIDNKPVIVKEVIKKANSDHAAWNDLLKKHVSATGKVNYKGFKEDLEILETYIRSLNESAPAETASKETRLAYWINAYNAVTVRLIVANYPVASITKLDGGKPWDVKRYSNGGKKMSLNDIENNILRPMGDARIHFALNCAAKSCPPLLNEAFTTENVNKLLEQRTRQFINSSRTVIEKDAVKVSKVFDWYGKDFGNVVDFVNKYAKTKASKTAKVSFADYDWSLND
jgi:Protein of unknown function, DUF547